MNLLVPGIGTIRIATDMRSPIGFRVQFIKSISKAKVLRARVQGAMLRVVAGPSINVYSHL